MDDELQAPPLGSPGALGEVDTLPSFPRMAQTPAEGHAVQGGVCSCRQDQSAATATGVPVGGGHAQNQEHATWNTPKDASVDSTEDPGLSLRHQEPPPT